MPVTRKKTLAAVAALSASALILTGCSAGGGGSDDNVLRIAMGSPGEAQIRVWDDVAAQFEAANPDLTVEMNYQDDDLYQTIGLPNLLNGRNAPDIYFEWAGARLEQRAADGFAADLSDAVTSGPIAGLFDDEVFGSLTVDGEIVMVPHAADVANVLWYNEDIFADAGLTPPTTWDELLATCDALDAEGIIPIASGNKDLWAAGNWLAHLTSRVVGEEAYSAALSGEADFDTPEWVEAFGYVEELADHNCVNESANAVDDNEGAQLFFQGKAAMHAIGSWLVSWAIDEAPDLNFDYVNLPTMPGEGNQESVIGVVTGYVVNAKSNKQDLAAEFLALLNNEENVQAFIGAELTPMALSASSGEEIDSRSAGLINMLESAPAIVLPPDTGYDLETANALYAALAEVLGGQTSPADAVAGIDQKLG
ncbi:carbohydrate ABC transporter substrate-binding protein (CUT1 family) [Salinibacterium amurskyense]|uniref:Carbohydrate ABC transporter substrate-binding protein (CUT1 family) n=1 Tax=Salinibacterium amurskyense TaxID=205941 RepID=A0A2M9D646_9MICO|nr:sugar ABC transporter substrate-binding protein [Salinibacterium amurskyense]PJJ81120.1 carbohydrate ABC transporter substrate-binding protein (CUT1 family) [Salinibacterium amurskyense]RLQ83146.1 sugar ABC transporter substrate-binding protein [Salinibacterium amurskyense]GHD81540.1 sugar-binding protein [Salinibacterium amurskyense]